jgi:hypothetical protein
MVNNVIVNIYSPLNYSLFTIIKIIGLQKYAAYLEKLGFRLKNYPSVFFNYNIKNSFLCLTFE